MVAITIAEVKQIWSYNVDLNFPNGYPDRFKRKNAGFHHRRPRHHGLALQRKNCER